MPSYIGFSKELLPGLLKNGWKSRAKVRGRDASTVWRYNLYSYSFIPSYCCNPVVQSHRQLMLITFVFIYPSIL